MKSILIAIALLVSGLAYGQTAEEYLSRGNSKIELEDYRGAIADYNKIIELIPNESIAYYNRGIAKEALEDYRGAIADYNKALELNPYNANIYHGRGNVKFKLEDYRGAIADYNKIIDLYPNHTMASIAYHSRGVIKEALEDYKGAIAEFTKAIELRPNYADPYFGRGLDKLKLGQKDEGCMDLSKAGELGYSKAYDYIKQHCN